jgi:hypothetical protein
MPPVGAHKTEDSHSSLYQLSKPKKKEKKIIFLKFHQPLLRFVGQ